MGSLYAKRGTWWARYKDETGKWKGSPTGYPLDERKKAEKVLRALEEKIAPKDADAVDGTLTVRKYLSRWTAERHELKKVTADLDKQRITDHAESLLDMQLQDVRPRHIRELVLDLRKAAVLAPRTIRNVYGALHSMFHNAVAEELITATPCVLARGVLPKIADKDPKWRKGAVFTRDEVAGIIADDRILPDRRVSYALMALAGLRHGEAANLRWRDIERRCEPLAAIHLTKTKTKEPRSVPVHPALARILGEWHLIGWEVVYGRPPRPDDLVCPTRTGRVRNRSDAQHSHREDLERVGLRARRQHDYRRTFITLTREDGARSDLLEAVTHGPRGRIIDVYTTWPWPALCAEVAKLRIEVPREACYHVATRRPTISNYSDKLVTPPGLEPAQSTLRFAGLHRFQMVRSRVVPSVSDHSRTAWHQNGTKLSRSLARPFNPASRVHGRFA
jgi:integrase